MQVTRFKTPQITGHPSPHLLSNPGARHEWIEVRYEEIMRDANRTDKWDLFTMASDGSNVTQVAGNASWGNWLDDERIIFVRGGRIVIKTLASGTEEIFLREEESEDLEGLLLQQPQLSPDGNFLGLTLRGGRRETGVWEHREKVWNTTGSGCEINWWPDGQSVYWVNPSGNGGSELFRMKMAGGRPAGEHQRLMDIPGRRSHEYFPQLSDDGTWMVWAATQRGHDHDIADYEIYIWQVGAPHEEATRLTFHSGNDRWPDIHLH
jgi:Tol biopolymer transport system component